MITFRLTQLIVLILLTCSTAIYGYDLKKEKKPLGPLGVTLDRRFANSWPIPIDPNDKITRRNIVLSSNLVFADPVSRLSVDHLWQIAIDAHNEMVPDMVQYDVPRNKINKPLAMTVLAFDKEIILASSQKGANSYAYEFLDTPVLQTLQLCMIGDNKHMHGGGCGEVMAAQLYYTKYPDIPLSTRGARIGTVLWNRNTEELEQTDPCGTDKQAPVWGCNAFVERMQLIPMNTKVKPAAYNLSALSPKPVSQIQLQCTKPAATPTPSAAPGRK